MTHFLLLCDCSPVGVSKNAVSRTYQKLFNIFLYAHGPSSKSHSSFGHKLLDVTNFGVAALNVWIRLFFTWLSKEPNEFRAFCVSFKTVSFLIDERGMSISGSSVDRSSAGSEPVLGLDDLHKVLLRISSSTCLPEADPTRTLEACSAPDS